MASDPTRPAAGVDAGRSDATAALTARRLARLAVIVPLLAAAVAFAPVATFGYVHVGDPAAVLHNRALAPGSQSRGPDFFWLPGFTAPAPVAVATFALQGEPDPDGAAKYHVVNLLLHLGAVALAVILALRLGAGPFAAALCGAVLALHPAVGEPVGWLTARPTLLATTLGLAAIHLHVSARRWLALALWMLAAGSHPAAALLPIVFIGIDRVRAGGSVSVSFSVREWLTAAASVVLCLALLGPLRWPLSDAAGAGDLADNARRAALATGIRAGYLMWPATLGTLPGRPEGAALVPAFALGITAAVLAVALLAVGCRRASLPWLGLLWAVMAQLPTLGLLPIERPWNPSHLYPSLPGLALAAGVLLAEAPRLRPFAAVAALALLVGSMDFAGAYASPDALVTASHRVRPGSPEALLERARARRGTGHPRAAMRLISQLETEFPDFRAHLRTKGDILRDAGEARTAYWAFVFAVRTGDESPCDLLIGDTLASGWTPGDNDAPEVRTCLRRVLPRIFGGDSEDLRQKAMALARKVGYTP